MSVTSEVILYILTFISVYVQVFFFITFLENRKKIVVRKTSTKLSNYPRVTIIVPCWNEEKTVYKTVRSLLNQNYPKNKLQLFLIDDGSTDNTFRVISRFAKYSNVKVFKKENGGKSSALNMGLEKADTPYVGCLDADSIADSDALVRLMSYFEKDKTIMAVAPSVVVSEPKTMVQKAQRAEYNMGVFFKKMQGLIGAIHVTPGPLTIYKKKVFEDLGPYRHAHNTEDMEIAYRMQKNYYKIEQCNDAVVYTNTPHNIKGLYRQRLRWLYGFLNNTIDYRKIMFRKKYGNFSLLTVPASIFSTLSICFLAFRFVYKIGEYGYSRYLEYSAVGVNLSAKVPTDLYFVNIKTVSFMSIIIFLLLLASITLGRRMVESKWKAPTDIFYFIFTFSFVGPFWILKAVYNTVLSRKPAWR